MGAIVEVKYFNSFLLKKTHTGVPTGLTVPVWDGSTGVPAGVDGSYPRTPRNTITPMLIMVLELI
jgi:hypothetical protein